MGTSSSTHDDGFGEVSYSAAERPIHPHNSPMATSRSTSARGGGPIPAAYAAYGPVSNPPGSGSLDSWIGASGQAVDATGYPLQQPESRTDQRVEARTAERGVSGIVALLILIAVCGIGGFIDLTSGTAVKGGFNIALVVGAVISVLMVRRSSMFPVVVAPPIVYFLASATLLYIRSDGLKNRGVLLDAGVNWLVYGFPAIAGATAAVLIIAGTRMVAGK